jgi:hypothetical protein
VSDYRLLGASSLILYEIVEIKNMNKLIKYMKYLLILDCSAHKRKECTSSLSSDSAQSDSSDDESCSVDNDDAQTESVAHESTQSSSQQNQKTMTLNKQPPKDGVKTPKKAGSR